MKFLNSLGLTIDLAIEAHELLRGEAGIEISGVKVIKDKKDNFELTRVEILNEHGAAQMQRPIGKYITIDAPILRSQNKSIHKEIMLILSEELKSLLPLDNNRPILIVGLGNWHATPDALGPKVVDYVLVTRHLFNLNNNSLTQGFRNVAAISPGVLGITGIETVEIIKGIVDKINPSLVIAVDALAAANVERICSSIQLADTGISPGSGIGNRRPGLNKEVLGVPVIAIGCPTVVNAAIIAKNTIEMFLNKFTSSKQFYQFLKTYQEGIATLVREVLEPYSNTLTVTPKEIDVLILNLAKVIAGGITLALHESVKPENVDMYLN
ncbi:GPR endopeptidase [Carboxydothermus pertinax]|nr:GPR endopeptidase [Carboxydothermus pertinax]